MPPTPCDPTNVFFAANSAELGDREHSIIRQAAQIALQHRIAAGVEGHADVAESDPDTLSARRAHAVQAELLRDGLAARDVDMLSVGSMDPLAPEPKDDAGHAQNRRVAINICTD